MLDEPRRQNLVDATIDDWMPKELMKIVDVADEHSDKFIKIKSK